MTSLALRETKAVDPDACEVGALSEQSFSFGFMCKMVGRIFWHTWHDIRFLQTLLMCPFSRHPKHKPFAFRNSIFSMCAWVMGIFPAYGPFHKTCMHLFIFIQFRDGRHSSGKTAPPHVLLLHFRFSSLRRHWKMYLTKHSLCFSFQEVQEIFKVCSSVLCLPECHKQTLFSYRAA